jgi:hypothetical protein
MRFMLIQARQRKLQADAEHQEYHAELGQVARLLAYPAPSPRMRPDRVPTSR